MRIFGDFAAVQDNAANRLHVEMTHVEEAAAGFADHREGFNEQVVEGRALRQFFLEFNGFGGEVDIGKLLDVRLQVVDAGDKGLNGLDFALVFGAKNLALGQRQLMRVLVTEWRSALSILARVRRIAR